MRRGFRVCLLLALALILGGCWSSQTRSVRETVGVREGQPFEEREVVRSETDSGPDVGAMLQAAVAALRKDVGGVIEALRPKLDQHQTDLAALRPKVDSLANQPAARQPVTGNPLLDMGVSTAIAYIVSKFGYNAVSQRKRFPQDPTDPQTPRLRIGARPAGKDPEESPPA